MFAETYDTITDLAQGLTKRVAMAKKEDLSFINGADVQLHDVTVKAESCKYDFDLKDIWVGKSRWTTLVRQYIDPVALESFLGLIEDKMKGMERGQAFMRTRTVAPRNAGAKETRRWGSCIIGFGFRAKPKPSLTMHSRTTFLGYIGSLDLAVAYHLSKLIAERLGINHEDIAFVWNVEAAQFHSSRSIAWWFQQERNYLDTVPLEKARSRPGLAAAIRQYNRYKKMDEEGVKYADLSFVSQLRPRKRIHTEVFGYDYGEQFEGGTKLSSASSAKRFTVLPSVPVDELDFNVFKKVDGNEHESGFLDPSDCGGDCREVQGDEVHAH